MGKLYRDIESGEVITIDKLRQEFAARLMGENGAEYEDMTFADYLHNCLTENNGTLVELRKRKFRVTILQTVHIKMEVEVEAKTEQEAIEEFDRNNQDGEYWEKWDDAYTYGEVESETMDIVEVEE